jgi:hypothetical protein
MTATGVSQPKRHMYLHLITGQKQKMLGDLAAQVFANRHWPNASPLPRVVFGQT